MKCSSRSAGTPGHLQFPLGPGRLPHPPPAQLRQYALAEPVRLLQVRVGLGLKLLSVRRVAERVRRGETAAGPPVGLDMSLREALSAMTERHADRLPVCDAAGHMVGAVTLADLVR